MTKIPAFLLWLGQYCVHVHCTWHQGPHKVFHQQGSPTVYTASRLDLQGWNFDASPWVYKNPFAGIHGLWQKSPARIHLDSCVTLRNSTPGPDVTSGRLRTSLRVTIKLACFATIPYYKSISWYLAWNTQSTGSDITSNFGSCTNCRYGKIALVYSF